MGIAKYQVSGGSGVILGSILPNQIAFGDTTNDTIIGTANATLDGSGRLVTFGGIDITGSANDNITTDKDLTLGGVSTNIIISGESASDDITLNAINRITFNGNPKGTIESGAYTPTVTNGTNVSSSSGNVCHWTRVGNEVHVDYSISVTSTAITASSVLISLPVSSTLGTSTDLVGGGNTSNATKGANVLLESDTAGQALCNFSSLGVSSGVTINGSFTYTIN